MKSTREDQEARDLLDYLKREGYIEKAAQSQTGFYCSSKTCAKVLESDFKSFGVPKSRHDLRERLRKYASKNASGQWESAPDLVTRCLICAYRGYRNLHKKNYEQYPDDDVPDDFNTNSETPKPKSPVKSRARSPVRQSGFNAPRSGDTENQLYRGFKDFMMLRFSEVQYAGSFILEWLSFASQNPALNLGLILTAFVVIDLFHPVWYLPTRVAWEEYNRQPSKYSLKELSECHYLSDSIYPGYLVNPRNVKLLKVNVSDVKVIKTLRTAIPFTLPNGKQESREVIVRVIDQVLTPQMQTTQVDREAVFRSAIKTMRDLGAEHWASLWELAIKRNKIPADYEWPDHPVFIVPNEKDIQYIMREHMKANTLLLDPGPTAVGWEIFLCNFGSLQGLTFTSVKGHRFKYTMIAGSDAIDGQIVIGLINKNNISVYLIEGLLSIEELSNKVRK